VTLSGEEAAREMVGESARFEMNATASGTSASRGERMTDDRNETREIEDRIAQILGKRIANK
jgi:hypothetical protein